MDEPAAPTAGKPADPNPEPAGGSKSSTVADATDVLPDAETRRRRKRRSTSRTIVEWILLVGAALLIAVLIKTFLFQAFWIPSESMLPTLQKNDRVLVNKLSYRLHDVHRGDIVVFEAPPDSTDDGIKDLVKRVIGLPGETIAGIDGKIYIDGQPLDEPYLPDGTISRTFPAETVPPNTVYVLGDNRLNSSDSTRIGPIDQDAIVGRVFVRIWPPSRLGWF